MTLSQVREKVRSCDTVWYFGVDDDVTPIAGKIKAVFHWRMARYTRLEVQALLSPGSPRRILPIYAVFAKQEQAYDIIQKISDAATLSDGRPWKNRERFLTIRTAIMIDQFEKDMAVSGDEKTTASSEDLGDAAKIEYDPKTPANPQTYPAIVTAIRRMAVSLQAMPDANGPTVSVSEADLLAILDTYQGDFPSDREFRAYVRLLGECPHWCGDRPWEASK